MTETALECFTSTGVVANFLVTSNVIGSNLQPSFGQDCRIGQTEVEFAKRRKKNTDMITGDLMKKLRFVLLFFAALFVGCATVGQHREAVRDDSNDRLSVGKVQREIRVGMTNAQVVEVLGSPNMVTTDEKRREVWVYDKVATDHAYSTSSGGVSALILAGVVGGSSAGAGGLGGSYYSGAGASSTTQRTLTIIIKFDEENKVRDFAYRQSSF